MKRLLSVVLAVVLLLGTLCVSASAAQSLVLGDINSDGVVSTYDVQRVLLKISGKALPSETAVLADYDFNGSVNNTDAYSVLKCAAGIILPQTLLFEAWQTEVAPTCTSTGTESSLCKAKNIKRTRSIPKLEHSFADGVCSGSGWVEDATGRINVNSKTVKFGDSIAKLTQSFGTPTEILTDNISGGAVKYYVYAADYKNLVIFTCSDTKGVIGVYTTSKTLQIVLSEVITFAKANELYSLDDVTFNVYTDTHTNGSPVYSIYATTEPETCILNENSNTTTQEKLIYHSLNAARAINGKAALVYDTEFAKMALYHSKDMADNDYFDHTSPNGEEFTHRLEKFGFSPYGAGENIAVGNAVAAYRFNDLWYNSEGHRKNMLLDDYTNIGIGIASAYSQEYGCQMYYATQNFRLIYE